MKMDLQNFVYPIAGLVGVAVMTEAVVEIIKTVVPATLTDNGKKILALVVSIILAFTFNVSLVSTSGPTYFVGILLAGLVASRGSNYVHSLEDIVKSIGSK
jgi:hypothetical protein